MVATKSQHTGRLLIEGKEKITKNPKTRTKNQEPITKKMDKDTFERQKSYAGEKRESMLRRKIGHDYAGRCMYMITMVVEGKRPLLGRLAGRSDADPLSPDVPRVELSALGRVVKEEWWGIPKYYPEIEIVALQVMPDHLHGILFVTEAMTAHLGQVMKGFKTGCNRAYRKLGYDTPKTSPQPAPFSQSVSSPLSDHTQAVQYVATVSQPKSSHPHSGFLFSPGFNDRILYQEGQLENWKQYLKDNPRRLLMRKEFPHLFRVQFDIHYGSHTYSTLGNRFLLDVPEKMAVQCSRSISEEELRKQTQKALLMARDGVVHVSPAISKGEKAIMRALFDARYPIILLVENGLTAFSRPHGEFYEACAKGHLLIMSPWQHHNERLVISREQCLTLNELAREICQ